MQRDREYLLDILDAARLALNYVAGKSLTQFLADTQCQDAVLLRRAVIGEAARRLSTEARAELPNLAWDSMIGMRNIVIHQYREVDLEIVWDTVNNDLPTLVDAIEGRGQSDNAS